MYLDDIVSSETRDKRNQEYLEEIDKAVKSFNDGNKTTFDSDEFLKNGWIAFSWR